MMARAKNTTTKGVRGDSGSRRAIGYTRASTTIQEEGFGLDVQRDRVTQYAREHGFELVDIVREVASGGVRNGEEFSWEHRPALLAIMERAERGELDVLIVPRFDRLSRDFPTLIVLERRFRRFGAEIVSVAEEHNGDGAIGEYIRAQLALVAQLERALIRERLSAGKAKAKEQGRHSDGAAPYGYRSKKGTLTIDEPAAMIVHRIFDGARDGHTPGRIARSLNRDSIPTARAKVGWSPQTIRFMLTNPAYTGERYGVKSAHPAIVSRRRFNEVQRALEARARK